MIIGENLQQEAADNAGDASEEVDDNQGNVGRAGLFEPERCWVHQWGHGPAGRRLNTKLWCTH